MARMRKHVLVGGDPIVDPEANVGGFVDAAIGKPVAEVDRFEVAAEIVVTDPGHVAARKGILSVHCREPLVLPQQGGRVL